MELVSPKQDKIMEAVVDSRQATHVGHVGPTWPHPVEKLAQLKDRLQREFSQGDRSFLTTDMLTWHT
jgi:hypothetical protein